MATAPPFSLVRILPFLIPIVLLQLGLMVFALVDLSRREKTRGPDGSGALVIILVS